MGLDTSSHAIDVDLVQRRLIPHILAAHPIDDLIQRAVRNKLAAIRANTWSLSVLNASYLVTNAEIKNAPMPEKPTGFIEKMLGNRAKPLRAKPLRLPGFDSDLHVWGRPFFIHAENPAQAAQSLDDWLIAAQSGDGAVDARVHETLAALESKRIDATLTLPPEQASILDALSPLDRLSPAPPNDDDYLPTAIEIRKAFERDLAEMCEIANAPDPDAILRKTEFGYEFSAYELQARLPYDIINFASAILPGWMSRGSGYASNVFGMIGIKETVFESPETLFAPLAERCPNFSDQLFDTIPENYALGGYVPPERVARLIEILDTRREDYVLVFENATRFMQRKRSPAKAKDYDLDEMDSDWRKVRETAEYAFRKGYGYLEGAEVYSGFLGQMN